MKYRFEISSVAEAEADGAFLRMSQLTSPERASRWYEGLLKAIESLSEMPKRCPLAGENDYFTKELKKFGSSSMVEGATHTVSFSLLWKVKMCLRFAFSTSDTPHSKHWVKVRNPVKPSTASLPEEELPTERSRSPNLQDSSRNKT